jgi:nucleoside-diphosphate-sugar epimerase
MRVAITGVAGYVGSVLSAELLARGHEIRGLDNLMRGGDALVGAYGNPAFCFQRGDVRDGDTVKRLVADVDAVVHLAAIVGDPACARDPELARAVNQTASVGIAEAARDLGVGRFVFASTCSNYGKMSNGDDFVDETSPLQPLSVYAETKVAVERFLLGTSWPSGFTPTVLRLATVYGLSYRPRFDLTVNEFSAELLKRGALTVYGESFWRPYVHVRDVSRAILAVLLAPPARIRGEVFNVGATEENYQKRHLVEMIARRVPDTRVEYVHREEDPRDYRVRFDKIRRVLGFVPQRSVAYGIDEILGALRDGVVRDPFDPRFRN